MPANSKPLNFELWSSEEEGSLSFFESKDERSRRLLSPDSKLIWRVDAPSWVEAKTRLHEHMGWEPYVPPDDAAELGLT